MNIKFTKMHGLGNDFIVINAVENPIELPAAQIKQWANRHTGIGFDQCLLIEKPRDTQYDFYYRIFNTDGTEVGQCGNGARCVARFLQQQGLTNKHKLTLATATIQLKATINEDKTVTINMGHPKYAKQFKLQIDSQNLILQPIDVGNPHVVLTVENLVDYPIETVGSKISKHPNFENGVNAGFMQILSPNKIALRVYERGSGETLACGSGACAAVIAGRLAGKLEPKVEVILTGGNLSIAWRNEQSDLLMTGPAEFVYTGEVNY